MKKVFGIVGWSGSGKTDLVSRLIKYFVKKSIIVASIKHTHHKFEIDREGKDSFKHIHAGSNEVIIYSKRKWAMISKFQQRDINIEDILNKFDDKTEFVLVEGLKYSTFPKIEVIRSSLEKPTLFENDKNIKAIVCDKYDDCYKNTNTPIFIFNETDKIGNFIQNYFV